MKSLVLLWWISAVGAGSHALGEIPFHGNTPIRVLLDRVDSAVPLESSQGSLFAKAAHPGPWIPLGRKVTLTSNGAGTKALVDDGKIKVAGSPLYLRGGTRPEHALLVGENAYRGLVKIVPRDGKLLVVNIVPLEEYLAGILAAEMNASWGLEALKAQAVASRSYALFMALHPKDSEYDVARTIEDQVYKGLGAEHERALQAIQATKGEYLTEGSGPVRTFFHARCGGTTDTERTVWRGNSARHGEVPCDYCRQHPYSWSHSVPYGELANALNFPRALRPSRVEVAERAPSGRLRSLRLSAEGLTQTVDADVLRARLGYQKLKSASFSWALKAGSIEFRGTGNGHGVGMCQWGAGDLARKGKSYLQILNHYYPRLNLSRTPVRTAAR